MKKNDSILKIIVTTGGPIALFLFLIGVSITMPEHRFEMLRNGGYFFLIGLFIAWLIQVFSFMGHIHFSIGGFLQRYWKGLVVAFLLTGTIALAVAPHFRVLDDETNLISVSNTMIRDRKIYGVTQGKYMLGVYYTPLDQYAPKRPLMFPFLVHILHIITGQHWQNGFLLNLIILFAFLSMIYIAALRFVDHWGALAAMFFFLSNPIAALCARSSGFDLLSAFWFFLVLINLYGLLMNRSAQLFALLWVNLIIFANIRYENGIFFFIIQAGLLAFKYYQIDFFKQKRYLVAITPLLLMPLIWQFWLSVRQFSNPDGTSLIGLRHFWPNLKIFADHQFGFHLPFNATFSDLALPGFILIIGYLCFCLIQKKIQFKFIFEKHFAIILALCLCASLTICLSYTLGQITLKYMQRIFLPMFIIFSMAPVMLVWVFRKHVSGRHLLLPAVMLFILYLPISVYPQYNGLYYPGLEYKHDFLKKYRPKEIMVITLYPGRMSAMGYGAINFTYANKNKEELLKDLKRHTYADIIVFQRVGTGNDKIHLKTHLDPDFELEPLSSFRTDWKYYLQTSRVVLSP